MTAASDPDIESTIARFIVHRYGSAIRSPLLDVNASLFSSGIIDSFGVLELIAFLEETFAVRLDPAVHELSEFDTVAKCAMLVARSRSPRAM